MVEVPDIPESERAAALRWFADQPKVVKIEVMAIHAQLVMKAHQKARHAGDRSPVRPEVSVDLLADASRIIRHQEESLRLKERLSAQDAKAVHKRRVTRFKASRRSPKSSPKREEIRLKFYHLVQELRQMEGFGWRNCAAYLKEHHRFTVTHMYLREVVEDLQRLERGVEDAG